MSALPLGYRAGWYTGDDLRNLRVPEAAVLAAEALRDATPAAERRGWACPDSVGLGRQGPARNVEALIVLSFGLSELRWLPDFSGVEVGIGTFKAHDGTVRGPDIVLATWHEGTAPLRAFPGTVCLFARLWRHGAPLPCLTLRASGGDKPVIALEGLETVRSSVNAQGLLKHLRFLERLAAGGPRPRDRRETLQKAEKLRRDNPRMTWPQIAARLGVPVSTLFRWRANTR